MTTSDECDEIRARMLRSYAEIAQDPARGRHGPLADGLGCCPAVESGAGDR